VSDSVDVVVIGAGVVGLAVARALAMQGRETIVLERHGREGEETSSRNSGVIHSGIYYPPGSLKARMCVRGRELLYEYCRARGIPHDQCGKLLVAQQSQVGKLHALVENGRRNGVHDLKWLEPSESSSLEPEVRCDAAVWCPSTGIVDAHELMSCLLADLEAHGGAVAFGTDFESARTNGNGFQVTSSSSGDESVIECRLLINSAGLSAPRILDRIVDYPAARRRTGYYAKGHYFSLRGASPFRHLVYPMPGEAGLGVHATLDLAGKTRFGPDVEWVQELDYQVDTARAASFYQAIREYWPGLPDGALQPDYSGIRPKLVGPGASAADFEIEGPEAHGLPGLINLLGIESPGLTSSLAIGEYVTTL
jgi:L-2-hydroxyglutarate oxidase LhgO